MLLTMMRKVLNYVFGLHDPPKMDNGNYLAEFNENEFLMCPFCGQDDWKKRKSLVIYCPTCMRTYENFGCYGLRLIENEKENKNIQK